MFVFINLYICTFVLFFERFTVLSKIVVNCDKWMTSSIVSKFSLVFNSRKSSSVYLLAIFVCVS